MRREEMEAVTVVMNINVERKEEEEENEKKWLNAIKNDRAS